MDAARDFRSFLTREVLDPDTDMPLLKFRYSPGQRRHGGSVFIIPSFGLGLWASPRITISHPNVSSSGRRSLLHQQPAEPSGRSI